MSDLLRQLRADARDRQTLVFMLIGAGALVAAVAWIALGSHAESAANPPSPQPIATVPSGQNVSDGTTVGRKRRETRRHERVARRRRRRTGHSPSDPFTALEAPSKTESSSGTKNAVKFGATVPSESKTTGGGGSKATKHEPTENPNKVTVVRYVVGIEYVAQSNGGPFELTLGTNLTIKAATPATSPALFWLHKVDKGGKGATFKLGKNVKVVSGASCLPSKTRCEEVDLKIKQSVNLEWSRGSEPPVDFEVLLKSISRGGAGAANFQRRRSK